MQTAEDLAPPSQPHKRAALHFPAYLAGGLTVVGGAFSEVYEFPDWIKVITALIVVPLFLVMVMTMFGTRGEPLDERDRLIELKATRRAYFFLFGVLMIPYAISINLLSGPPIWDPAELTIGLAILSQAVYHGSLLLLYRPTADV